MSTFIEFESRVKPYVVATLTISALLKMFSTQRSTHPQAYLIANFIMLASGIPYFVLLIQKKKNCYLDVSFHLALMASLILEWR